MKKVSAEVVIGNLIIEAIQRGKREVTSDQFIDFDNSLSAIIKHKGMMTDFTPLQIYEFELNYPYFVEVVNDSLKLAEIDKGRWIQCFRAGLPISLIKDIKQSATIVFDSH